MTLQTDAREQKTVLSLSLPIVWFQSALVWENSDYTKKGEKNEEACTRHNLGCISWVLLFWLLKSVLLLCSLQSMCSSGSVLGVLSSFTWTLFSVSGLSHTSFQKAMNTGSHFLTEGNEHWLRPIVPKPVLQVLTLDCLVDTFWNLQLPAWNMKASMS